MQPVKKILNKLNGLHYRQEYLCFSKESHTDPLYVYIVNDGHIIKDITNQHLFTGYNPVIFAMPADPGLPTSLRLIFSQHILLPNELFSKKDALAFLEMKIIHKQVSDDGNIFYYEGSQGRHFFISPFHQYINQLYNQLYNKKTGNVFLYANLYKQVQIAYAIPRIISLITVSDGKLFNLFPTDLHGQVDETHYIISLRSNGKACAQVEAAGRILLSTVNSDLYKTVYMLGKNHMQPLRMKMDLPFSQSSSARFQLPIPGQSISYRELELQDHFIHGIHKILLFKIVFQQQLQPVPATLCHIHNSYATWRYKNKLRGNYLLR